ncbi:MAG: bifunctional UDP-N-acetylmuramoyl-tripeptide:D-alanyl-D-alanine ligase/alanine racemase, partial [Bacteroidota bacterium]|nr:bifunctional UDP-N-acetylmuramoyl-tripeptide:D-alanyl-D-alanine ligase/alanine racemase [Bacteroidota bacterium]
MYTIATIAGVINAKATLANASANIEHLLTDSRRIAFPLTSLFFAIASSRRDGHDFIDELYAQGVQNFVVQHTVEIEAFPNANFLRVDNTLHALQQLAAWHRNHFQYPVIGITGSNGKTIVKEWLYQLLSSQYNIVRSPRSYNSQIGVPLSVWQMNDEYNLAIFEAGISMPEEMNALQNIIQPTLGIFTNIGEAHSENFANKEQKAREKIKLFAHCEVVFYNSDNAIIQKEMAQLVKPHLFSWGTSISNNQLRILSVEKGAKQTQINAVYQNKNSSLTIPFTDDASIENAITCWCMCLYFGLDQSQWQQGFRQLQSVNMRLQLVKGLNGCSLINDSYSFDIYSFNIALDFLLQQNQYTKKTVIISDFAVAVDDKIYKQIADVLHSKKINRVITVGEVWFRLKKLLQNQIEHTQHFITTQSFIQELNGIQFHNEAILLKGARRFQFENIAAQLEEKVHRTVMEINLTALAHNLKQYQQRLQPGTKLMAMIKAGGYGSGSAEVANVLQFHKVDYVAVAYADEGTELRKAGIRLPVMVLNVDEAAFETLIENNLEPELFSFALIFQFDEYLLQQGIQQYPVHLKIDTGMHRLGFEESDLPQLVSFLQSTKRLAVKSVLSHLAASEAPDEDEFTLHQYEVFNRCCNQLQEALGYHFIRHIANSAAIFRHPNIQLDMVRLGIGMYGVDSANEHKLQLQTVCTLKTTIAQLREVKGGDTVGYNRRGVLQRDSLIATIRIG